MEDADISYLSSIKLSFILNKYFIYTSSANYETFIIEFNEWQYFLIMKMN